MSDVVVDNFAAGVLRRRGLGYEELRQVKPDVIVLSMPGYGFTGPYSPVCGVRSEPHVVLRAFLSLGPSGVAIRQPAEDSLHRLRVRRLRGTAIMAALEYRGRPARVSS